MNNKIYVIFADSIDDSCNIVGYVQSEEAAEMMCAELNAKHPAYFPEYQYMELDNLEKQ